jgi:hypothetical protein
MSMSDGAPLEREFPERVVYAVKDRSDPEGKGPEDLLHLFTTAEEARKFAGQDGGRSVAPMVLFESAKQARDYPRAGAEHALAKLTPADKLALGLDL